MKIYQIHKYGGDWEDYRDVIVGSYLSEERAIFEKGILEKKYEESRKCSECPLYFCYLWCNNDCSHCLQNTIKIIKDYCDKYKPHEKNRATCVNRKFVLDDDSFRIEEVEVIE